MKTLVTFSKDWADEFDVYGHKVYDSRADWLRDAATLDDLEFSFGTNEGWEAGDFSLSDFTVVDISDEYADILSVLFPRYWGHFPF